MFADTRNQLHTVAVCSSPSVLNIPKLSENAAKQQENTNCAYQCQTGRQQIRTLKTFTIGTWSFYYFLFYSYMTVIYYTIKTVMEFYDHVTFYKYYILYLHFNFKYTFLPHLISQLSVQYHIDKHWGISCTLYSFLYCLNQQSDLLKSCELFCYMFLYLKHYHAN